MLVRVPLQERDGTNRIEIELSGFIGKREGILDRKIFYQRIGGERPELLLPQQLRRSEQQLRRELFLQRLPGPPDRPDVSLLAPDTVNVPPVNAERVRPLPDGSQLIVRASGLSAEMPEQAGLLHWGRGSGFLGAWVD